MLRGSNGRMSVRLLDVSGGSPPLNSTESVSVEAFVLDPKTQRKTARESLSMDLPVILEADVGMLLHLFFFGEGGGNCVGSAVYSCALLPFGRDVVSTLEILAVGGESAPKINVDLNNPPNLHGLLEDDRVRKLLLEFATTLFAEEGLIFYERVKQFQRRATSLVEMVDAGPLQKEAQEIWNLFLAADAPTPLNISAAEREKAHTELMMSGEMPCFDYSLELALRQMQLSLYGPFLEFLRKRKASNHEMAANHRPKVTLELCAFNFGDEVFQKPAEEREVKPETANALPLSSSVLDVELLEHRGFPPSIKALYAQLSFGAMSVESALSSKKCRWDHQSWTFHLDSAAESAQDAEEVGGGLLMLKLQFFEETRGPSPFAKPSESMSIHLALRDLHLKSDLRLVQPSKWIPVYLHSAGGRQSRPRPARQSEPVAGGSGWVRLRMQLNLETASVGSILCQYGRPTRSLPWRLDVGDVLLMGGSSSSSTSRMSAHHAGVVVPRRGHSNFFLLEATSDGVCASPLEERLRAILMAGSNSLIGLRRLTDFERTPRFLEAAMDFVERFHVKNHEEAQLMIVTSNRGSGSRSSSPTSKKSETSPRASPRHSALKRSESANSREALVNAAIICAFLQEVGVLSRDSSVSAFSLKELTQPTIGGVIRGSFQEPLKVYHHEFIGSGSGSGSGSGGGGAATAGSGGSSIGVSGGGRAVVRAFSAGGLATLVLPKKDGPRCPGRAKVEEKGTLPL